jgi:hypothetical protein
MKDNDLLSIITEDAGDFRAQLLEQTLRVVRRKRRRRRCGQVLLTLAFFAAALWWTVPRPDPVQAPAIAALQIVNTRPTSVEIVSTRSSNVELVGDEELLEMVPGETKMLVWHAPGDAELIVVGP